jgi:hypothetical protein
MNIKNDDLPNYPTYVDRALRLLSLRRDVFLFNKFNCSVSWLEMSRKNKNALLF